MVFILGKDKIITIKIKTKLQVLSSQPIQFYPTAPSAYGFPINAHKYSALWIKGQNIYLTTKKMFGFFKKKNEIKTFRGWDVHFDASKHNIAELVNFQRAMHEKNYQREDILKISNILGYDIEEIAVFEPIEGSQMFLSMGSASLVKSIRDFDLNYHPVTGEDTSKEAVSEAFEFLKAQSIIVGNNDSANALEKISWPKATQILYDKGVLMAPTFEFYDLFVTTLMVEGKKRGACEFQVNEDGSPKVMPYSRRKE